MTRTIAHALREHGRWIVAGVIAGGFAFAWVDALAGLADTKHSITAAVRVIDAAPTLGARPQAALKTH
jgi:hypothetical protein